MLSHDRVWAAIDTLAKINGMSPSGLARRAGLDPTTFNRSKRIASDGRPRWPSTESISKVLDATGTAIGDFVMLLSPDTAGTRFTGPSFGEALLQVSERPAGFSEDVTAANGADASVTGASVTGDELPFPGAQTADVFALEVSGNSMLPHYRDGDTILVSRTSPVRRGDRVVVRTHDGEITPWVLKQRTTKMVELSPIGHERTKREVPATEIDWILRITWASQ
ncbi:helix-turn-helix transcriptional regulator [Breoghania sp.]|uniref:helix-turn-helix transcriptional regulator n=1 Tax=Breoghania sp. TaxID=2065378 RepID=UPI002AA79003|nr:helix-turn-helix transcriptional regulator [Breoghania sp.]